MQKITRQGEEKCDFFGMIYKHHPVFREGRYHTA